MKSMKNWKFLVIALVMPLIFFHVSYAVAYESDAKPQISLLKERLNDSKEEIFNNYKNMTYNLISSQLLSISNECLMLKSSLENAKVEMSSKLQIISSPNDDTLKTYGDEYLSKEKNIIKSNLESISTQINELNVINDNSLYLLNKIKEDRENNMIGMLTTHSQSILSPGYWAGNDADKEKYLKTYGYISDFFHQEINDNKSGLILSVVFLFSLIGFICSAFKYNLLNKILVKYFPGSKVVKSFLAITTLITLTVSTIIYLDVTNVLLEIPDNDNDLISQMYQGIAKLIVFTAVIYGIGKAILQPDNSSWRMSRLSDEVAKFIMNQIRILSFLMIIISTIDVINVMSFTSYKSTFFTYGLGALVIASSLVILSIKTGRIKSSDKESSTVIFLLLRLVTFITGVLTLALLIIGYIPLARYICYEFLWCSAVLGVVYISLNFVSDLFDYIFSKENNLGSRLIPSLNISDKRVDQLSSLLSAFFRVIIIISAAIIFLNNSLVTSSSFDFFSKVSLIWSNQSIGTSNIVPRQILKGILFLVAGYYTVKVVLQWLESDFLPKTSVDKGIQISILTLTRNVSYIFLVFITLAVIGVQWAKLAWIVSALSVGIGFGLQDIVKNFISGIILLTERPIKVGDSVGVSGVEGDVKRIKVRATEIQLSDKSTVFIPNSQLISQNVRNISMGNPLGVVTIALTFPKITSPISARDVMVSCVENNERFLKDPKPFVRFKDISENGLILGLTAYVKTTSMTSRARSDLLFDIYEAMDLKGIPLSINQVLILKDMD